jgi:tRNA(Ile)-lysidine synthase
VRGERLSTAPPPLAGVERLNGPPDRPIALALSGGGDSLALLHLAKRWADHADRRLIALTVDHGLNPESLAWTGFAAERAARLGVAHRTLCWRGEKPATGLPAAARTARHALLGEAARAAGASAVLLAHTIDDLLEAGLMRAEGSTTPSPRLWSPSPAWPEGRGVFLLRPLLGCRRAELRAFLSSIGESWIDDPANDDPRFARARARKRLACRTPQPMLLAEPVGPPPGLDRVREGAGGDLTAPRDVLVGHDSGRLLGALVLCAAGTTRPPSAASLDRLAERLAGDGDFVSTLAGARIEVGGDLVRFSREAGERMRGGLAGLALPPGETVFDGRFLLKTRVDGRRVAPLAGLMRRLCDTERARLGSIPPAVRRALPVVIGPSDQISCPAIVERGQVQARSLTLRRLRAALGVVADEAGAALAR